MTSKNPYAGSPVGVVVDVVNHQLEAFHQLTFLDKLALWASWAAAAGIFLTLGWMAMAPDDPYGAVTLLLRGNAVSVWLQAAGLAMVASAIATILVGRSLPYAGPFAAALGLAVVSLRGRTTESLLLAVRTAEMGTGSLAMQMSLDAIAWMCVLVLAFGISAGIARWCLPRSQSHPVAHATPVSSWPAPAFAVVAMGIALLAFNILGAGMHDREIRHTQVLFVVAASVWLGCYFAYRVVPALGIVWYVAAVFVMAVGSYVWASLQGDSATLPASVPPSNYLRVLPIQFVAVGVAAAIAAYWSNLQHHSGSVVVDESDGGEREGIS